MTKRAEFIVLGEPFVQAVRMERVRAMQTSDLRIIFETVEADSTAIMSALVPLPLDSTELTKPDPLFADIPDSSPFATPASRRNVVS